MFSAIQSVQSRTWNVVVNGQHFQFQFFFKTSVSVQWQRAAGEIFRFRNSSVWRQSLALVTQERSSTLDRWPSWIWSFASFAFTPPHLLKSCSPPEVRPTHARSTGDLFASCSITQKEREKISTFNDSEESDQILESLVKLCAIVGANRCGMIRTGYYFFFFFFIRNFGRFHAPSRAVSSDKSDKLLPE